MCIATYLQLYNSKTKIVWLYFVAYTYIYDLHNIYVIQHFVARYKHETWNAFSGRPQAATGHTHTMGGHSWITKEEKYNFNCGVGNWWHGEDVVPWYIKFWVSVGSNVLPRFVASPCRPKPALRTTWLPRSRAGCDRGARHFGWVVRSPCERSAKTNRTSEIAWWLVPLAGWTPDFTGAFPLHKLPSCSQGEDLKETQLRLRSLMM